MLTIESHFRLEGLVREALLSNDFERIQKIVKQLCNEFAYAVHQPHARNGGLIGLAAASIALGSVSSILGNGNTVGQLILQILGSCALLGGHCTTSAGMFRGPRCASAVLCLREYV